MEDRFNLHLHRSFFRSPSENTSRMQSTQTQWLYALITGKNFAAHVNWMNGKKSDAFARRCSVKKVF